MLQITGGRTGGLDPTRLAMRYCPAGCKISLDNSDSTGKDGPEMIEADQRILLDWDALEVGETFERESN